MENEPPPSFNAPPPVITPPPPSRPARPGRTWFWLLIAFAIAVGLGFVALGLFARSTANWSLMAGRTGRADPHWLDEVTVENNGSDYKIALIDIDGIITSMGIGRRGRSMVELIDDQLKMAARDHAVKAVILKVDSPGGEVMASDDISRALLDFQEQNLKPVVVDMGGMGASGGYYVSAPCQWIVANDLTMTGSIGVIMSTFNYRGLLDKVGIYPQVFKSGKFKDMLRGSKKLDEIDPEETRMLQTMIDETYAKFVSVVEQGRARAQKENHGEGRPLASNWKEFADGRVLTGKQAYNLGFVDELGDFKAAVRRARKLTKIPDANLIQYQEPFNLGSLFSLFGQSEHSSIKLDLGLDLPRLQAGRLYFLAPSVLR
jgi:protease-4